MQTKQITKPANHSHSAEKCANHACEHGCCSGEEGAETLDRKILARIIIAAVFLLGGLLLPVGDYIKLGLYFAALIIVGWDIALNAIRNIGAKRSFDENLLMTIACIGAFCLGEYAEGVLVMLLYQIGELFQDYAVGNSRKSIRGLMDLRPETVNIERDGAVRSVPAGDVRIGDVMIIRPGERVALDGVVLSGASTLDTSALTGESLARSVGEGEQILSGCLNLSGALTVRATALLEQSAVARIMEMVEEATEKKAEPEKFITRFAKYYTPIVFVAAILLAIVPPLVLAQPFNDWIYRALTFLVISCPCALVISVPLTYFAGIGGASRNGVLFKGSNSMDVLSKVKTVVFDKTGTLTTGEFQIQKIVPAPDVTEQELLRLAAHAESLSDHPLARSIVAAYGQTDKKIVSNYVETRGKGVSALIDGSIVLAGNRAYMESENLPVQGGGEATTVYVAKDGKLQGHIALGDTNKSDAAEAISGLSAAGVNRIAMLTGDNRQAAAQTAETLGIGEYYAGCLPEDKASRLQEIQSGQPKGGALAFVGDGINDAPVLAMADVGIAMGGLGSDAAIEAADVVIMNDAPSKLTAALKSAVRTKRIVVQNITFALVVKAAFLILGALGLCPMALAIFADVGVCLLAILNAMRAAR